MQELTIAAVIVFVVDWAIRIAALIIIPRDRKPTAAMAWLLAIFLIPIVGVFFFLLIGSYKLPKKRLAKQREIDAVITEKMAGTETHTDVANWPSWLPGVVELNRTLSAIPAVGGNSATLIEDYQGSMDAMAADIDTATTFVHIEFYIVSFDTTTTGLFAAIERAVARGVTVRVLLDHVASVRAANSKATFAELDRIGAKWSFMLPFRPFKGDFQRPDLRNHRKLVVVDGRVGFMGSQNLIDRTYNSEKNLKRGLMWQELMTRVTGPIVTAINTIFIGDWYCETNERIDNENVPFADVEHTGGLDMQLVPSGPGYDYENNLRLFLGLLSSAQQQVIITSPYFVPDESMMYAITSARQRGLEVQLFVSEIGDQGGVYHAQRSYYGELLRTGVRIFMYPGPYILHAKHLSIDDDVAVIGSSNMDIRSFNLDLEISLLVHGKSFVDDMRKVEQHYRDVGRELTLAEWEKEPLSRTFLDGVARLTSAVQ
jgi:cardiolipin synthase